ncbi:hypothetical protein NESM_000031000 [Novymonas esmeraldas]|uniref:BILBO1 N-terminal domain-containing protein n=1 Tax=Novymonas esmeraldas TaxID=1808958 RepID=A0AAW0F2G8_9TRYP
MFTVLCCADVAGEKVNLEVTLDAFPETLRALEADLARLFSLETQACAAAGAVHVAAGPFQVLSVYVYDDVLLRWVRLTSLSQLHEYDQLYLFQPQTQWHEDVQKDLPPPRPPMRGVAAPFPGNAAASSPRHEAYGTPSPQLRYASGVGGAPLSSTGPTRSPVRAQLEEQRREEERLAHRLSSVRSERERLEREALREEEDTRRRRAAETERLLRHKEREILSQREALSRAEEEFQRLLAEKAQLDQRSPLQ